MPSVKKYIHTWCLLPKQPDALIWMLLTLIFCFAQCWIQWRNNSCWYHLHHPERQMWVWLTWLPVSKSVGFWNKQKNRWVKTFLAVQACAAASPELHGSGKSEQQTVDLIEKKDLSAIHIASVAIHNTINEGLNSLKQNLSCPLKFLIDFTNSLCKSQNSLKSQVSTFDFLKTL